MDWAAIPGRASANLPTSVFFNGRDVNIYSFAQMDRIGKKSLKDRAMNLRDLVGADKLPRFSPGMQDEQMIAWLLEAQIIVAAWCGVTLTVADLGAPKGGDGVGAYLAHLQNAPSPAAQQRSLPPPQHSPPQFPPYHQQQPPPQQSSNSYEVETILDVRTGPSGIASHFLVKWVGRGMEEASWEPAAQMQAVDPDSVLAFKQRFLQQQQQRQPPPQQQQPRQPPPQSPSPFQQYHQYQPTDLRGNPIRSPAAFSPPSGSPLRPDQESDNIREAARRRNQGSNPFL